MRLAFARPLRTSRGVLSEREGFILELHADSGARGAGEASPAYWLGSERIEETRASLERIVDAVARHPEVSSLRASMLCLTCAAASAMDTALLEISARERGVTVASVLGARQLESIPVCALLSAIEPEELRSEASHAVRVGYRCLKLKLGADAIEDDVRRVEAVRQALGRAIAIRLDANRGWSLDQARAAVSRLGTLGIEFLEEPLKDATADALADLTATAAMPIALDESVNNLDDLTRYADRNAADVLVLKAARVGGLTPAMRLAEFAREAGMKVAVTDSIESPVGMSAAVHLAAAIGPPHLAIGLGGARVLAELGETAFVPSPFVRPAAIGLDIVCESAMGESCDA